ncbi:XrtA system polysaccharide chain length determinant [Geobacter sp. SVR]|uniref:XrtA system polysaccharide chain length determinant n=1 Tax=Geobacter sp. SVR TaxID=2495594 RepID=UPI00143EFF15|nr:XrtA system polysaccharide chain length determinant [Geobacter sp. SVR]BCS54986.1 chain-length determining protein [Geobacter sp. SVR]GCF85168.1 chain-length determining protein [Geobacter sp. SVR]
MESDFDYKKYLQLIVKRRYLFVVLALLIMTGTVIASYMKPAVYEAKSTVFIERSVIGDLVKGIAVTASFEDKIRVLEYAIKSRSLLLKVFDDLDLNVNKQNDSQLEEMVKAFQAKTDIRLKDKEGLFTIAFSHENPRLARDYVNALIRRYIEENSSSTREDSYGATRFLGEQIAAMKEKLARSDAATSSYRQEKGSLLAQSEEMISTEIGNAQQRIEEYALRRRQLESLLGLAVKNGPQQIRLAELKKRQQELSLVYTDNHPEIIAIGNEIASLQEQIKSGQGVSHGAAVSSPEQDRITLELKSLRESEQNQRRLIASKLALLKSIPAAKAGLEELERERASQKTLYEQLVARYGQSEVSKQMEVQDKTTTFRVVDPAVVPAKPTGPQRVRMILLGILGGLAGSFAILLLLDHLDVSVRHIDSLRSLGVQVLAVVPKIENPSEALAVRRRDWWFFSLAGIYFLLILATIPIEYMRENSYDILSGAGIRQNLANLRDMTFR